MKLLTIRCLLIFFSFLLALSSLGISYELWQTRRIMGFNQAIRQGIPPQIDQQSFEAKFATAHWLAKKKHVKEAILLFTQLLEGATPRQKSAILHNLGNIYFLRGIAINGTNINVGQETEYLLRQAKNYYQQALRIDNHYWGTRHNLDRLLILLPGTPVPGVGESDSPGLIMGNIPVGLP